ALRAAVGGDRLSSHPSIRKAAVDVTGPRLPNDTEVTTGAGAFDRTTVDPTTNPQFQGSVPATPATPAANSKAPLVIGLVAAVVVAGGAAAAFVGLRGGGAEKTPPAPSASVGRASASAGSATLASATCPAGMVLVPGGEFFM